MLSRSARMPTFGTTMLDMCRPLAARMGDVVRPKGAVLQLPQQGAAGGGGAVTAFAALDAPVGRWAGAFGLTRLAAARPRSGEVLVRRPAVAELLAGAPASAAAGEARAAPGDFSELPPSLWWPSVFLPSEAAEAPAEARPEAKAEAVATGVTAAADPAEPLSPTRAAAVAPRRAPEPSAALAVYDAQLRKVEGRCRDLIAENRLLKAVSDAAVAEQEKTRELNLRLSREVQQSRRSAAEAERRAAAVEAELRRVRDDLRLARRKAKTLAQPSVQLAAEETPAATADAAAADCAEDSEETAAELAEASPRSAASADSWEPAPCTCGTAWGCPQHLSYSGALLLAHRELSLTIAAGAPGLELDVPPGLGVHHLRLEAAPASAPQRTRSCAARPRAVARRPRSCAAVARARAVAVAA